jgi:hypothetical protein
MHTGQIIMIAKIFSELDLGFYGFSGGVPEPLWRA